MPLPLSYWLQRPLWQRATLFGLLYLACAEVGQQLSISNSPTATFWPPAGLFLAILLISPMHEWPAFILAASPANLSYDLLHGRSIPVSILFCFGNDLAAFTGAWLIQKAVGEKFSLMKPRHLISLSLFTAAISTNISAIFGAAALRINDPGNDFRLAWQILWSGNFLGVLAFAPVILSLVGIGGALRWHTPRRWIELGWLLLCLGIAVALVFFLPRHWLLSETYILAPFLIWAALRFGPRILASLHLGIAVAAIYGIIHNMGSFANPALTDAERVTSLQLFLSMVLFTILLVSAVWNERQHAELKLRQSAAELNKAQAVAHIGSWAWTPRTGQIKMSDETYRILGINRTPFQGFWSGEIDGVVHPDDRSIFADAVQSISKNKENIQIEYRIIHPDGSIHTVWLETGEILLDPDGHVEMVTGVLQDTTERKHTEEQAMSALKEKEALLRELHHRTKNNMQVICSMMSLQAATLENEQIIQAFEEMSYRIRSMAMVHQKLYQSHNLASIDLRDYVNDLANMLKNSYDGSTGQIQIIVDAASIPVSIDIGIPCGLIVNELVSNAFKHGFRDRHPGEIRISLKRFDDHRIELEVADNGTGIEPGFDFRRDGKMGIETIYALGEEQLHGSVQFIARQGVTCQVRFKDTSASSTSE